VTLAAPPGDDGAAPAAAAPPPPRAPDIAAAAEAPVRSVNYGGWTMAADLASVVPLALWLGRVRDGHNDLFLAAPELALVPLIHLAYREPGHAAISLLMRGAALGALYAVTQHDLLGCSSRGEEPVCIPWGLLIALDLTVVTPMLIDSAVLARTTERVSDWHLLPVLPAATAGGGAAMRGLALTARF
jgi:hypothetical protein